MTNIKNNVPVYVEEQQFFKEEEEEEQTQQQIIQEILNKFGQPVPSDFVKLKIEEGNYMFSTKWNDKPLCERYGFYLEDNEEEWVQIDILCELMETLEIGQGEDINHPLYLSPNVLEKQPIRGAITIENEEDIFIDKPVSEKVKKISLLWKIKYLHLNMIPPFL